MAKTAADQMAPQQTRVGHVSGAFGVKGWVKIQSYTSPDDGIFGYQPWRLTDRKGKPIGADGCVVRHWQRQGKQLVAQLQGVEDRNQAEALKGACIEVPRERFEPLPAGEYYWYQLIGLEVWVNQINGELVAEPIRLGRIDRLMETGANDVMLVAPTECSVDDKERCLPWLPGRHVLNVDLEQGLVEVDWDPEF